MTDNINDVMERLEGSLTRVTDWASVTQDLKALLSYTKQCREALEQIAAHEPTAGRSGLGDLIAAAAVDTARQAISSQPGERE